MTFIRMERFGKYIIFLLIVLAEVSACIPGSSPSGNQLIIKLALIEKVQLRPRTIR